MKKILFACGVVIAILTITSQVSAGEIIEDKAYAATVTSINYENKVIPQPVTAISPATVTSASSLLIPVVNQVSVASTIKAENVIAGVFAGNVGGGDFSFPANLSVAGRISSGILARSDGQITLYGNNENGDVFHIDNRWGGSLRISKGGLVGMVDLLTINGQFGSVGIGKTNLNPMYKLDVNGSIKANNYYAANGNIGLSNTYRLKANNGQNCFMTFNNGLLTNSDCPINSVLQESIK